MNLELPVVFVDTGSKAAACLNQHVTIYCSISIFVHDLV